jgi:hypothetical protein
MCGIVFLKDTEFDCEPPDEGFEDENRTKEEIGMDTGVRQMDILSCNV